MVIRMDEYLYKSRSSVVICTKPGAPPNVAPRESEDDGPNDDPPAAFSMAA
jgi:hypothetical protein